MKVLTEEQIINKFYKYIHQAHSGKENFKRLNEKYIPIKSLIERLEKISVSENITGNQTLIRELRGQL